MDLRQKKSPFAFQTKTSLSLDSYNKPKVNSHNRQVTRMINEFYNRNFPNLVLNDKFHLREQSLNDTEAFFNYYSDPLVAEHILATTPNNLADARAEIQYCRNLFYYKRGIYWTIACKEKDEMIGAIGLYINNNHHRAEICYDLSRHYWGQGIMTQAIHRIVEYAFQKINIHRLEALTLKANHASIAVLEKVGFVHEATLKNYRYYQNQPHDVEMYGLIPAMYIQQQARIQEEESLTTT